MTNHASHSHLSDEELIAEVHRCAGDEREATARLIAALAALDARRLYLGAGCSSLFTYCTQVLHFSEHAAYLRIEAARAGRKFPAVLERLADGSVHLTAIGLLAPHLTAENCHELLDAARHKSKREIEHLVAAMRPQTAVPSSVRKLPVSSAPRTSSSPACGDLLQPDVDSTDLPLSLALPAPGPAPRTSVTPLAPEQYKLQCTLSHETCEKLRRAQDLLRHTIPNGDPAQVLDRALTLLIESLEKKKLAATHRPRASRSAAKRSRHIPAPVKRAVWARDGRRCAFVGTEGRCRETGFLEIHHVVPYAAGGGAVVENLELRCRAHNVYEAERYFGNQLPLVREERAAFNSVRTELPDCDPDARIESRGDRSSQTNSRSAAARRIAQECQLPSNR
jgi:5-methylcytosine-specific restriction endonuclease McrA